jgi:hypothetical protein
MAADSIEVTYMTLLQLINAYDISALFSMLNNPGLFSHSLRL